jgi:UDPglucose 6-dehydrogenase
MAEREPIGVIGVGWVGLVTAACFAELGHEVWARDIIPEKVESLSRGEVPIHEPGLPELVAGNADRLHFTTSMSDVADRAELLVCCVDTPPTYSGDADLSRVESVVEELGDSDHALVMKSTVPVGTGRSIQRRREGLGYVSNPEFLKEGSAVDDFMKPDRVVIGAADGSEAYAERVASLYAPLDAPVIRTDLASAEMIKLASNAFLATKISFINEIANVSEEVGADVAEVARGMGLDDRIGPKFLQPGVGYGGSCLVGSETVLVRRQGRVWMWTLREMFEHVAEEQDMSPEATELLVPDELEVLSWRDGASTPEFLAVELLTRRDYEEEVVEVRTKMGRRVTCTPDHPFVVADADGGNVRRKLAEDLGDEDWVPVADGAPVHASQPPLRRSVLSGMAGELQPADVIVRPSRSEISRFHSMPASERATALAHPRGVGQRTGDIARSGALRLDETARLDLSLAGATAGTARNGTYVPVDLVADERFWRIVGLYIAEGHCHVEDSGRHRLQWSFHPTQEIDLVEEVAGYWHGLGVKATVSQRPTTTCVTISSRLLGGFWTDALGLGSDCYEQRIPDSVWDQPRSVKRALLGGLWRGDGSWSYVARGPSVVLEYGTASQELADGILRLLGECGLVAGLRVGRTAKSTTDNYWLRISGANQVERALFLVAERDRDSIRASLARQKKRIAPTGYRRHSRNAAWVRVVGKKSRPFKGSVYSMEVPDSHTFVTTGGLVVSNCFPKDVQALKQLAGNTGYAFQLLTAVIEVNELQKRRTIGKLQKHLGSLVGKEIALLGVAFKPNTDDVREATSLVLAGRLQSEGAHVRVYDPVAAPQARDLLAGTTVADSALEALDGADAAVLVTEWPEFRELDWPGEARERMRTPLVVDGRNFLDRELLKDAGFTYEGIGR